MGLLRDLRVRLGLDFDKSGFATARQKIDGLKMAAEGMVAIVAGSALARGVHALSVGVAEAADRVAKSAEAYGMTARAYQELGHAAELSGVDANKLNQSLGLLSQKARMAALGGQEAGAAFQRLGVSVFDANGQVLPAELLMERVADGLAQLENPTERTAVAMSVFGETGARLIPLLSQGGAGIRELRAEASALGGVYSDELIERSVEFNDNISRLQAVVRGAKAVIASTLIPALNGMAESLIRWRKERPAEFMLRLRQVMLFAAGAAAVLAAVAGVKLLIALGNVAVAVAKATLSFNALAWAQVKAALIPILIGAAFAGLILIVEDLWALFSGGESLIGDLIDKLFGVGTAAEVVENVKLAFERLWALIETVGGALLDVFRPELEALKELFVGVFETIQALAAAAARWVGEKVSGMIPDWMKNAFQGGVKFFTTKDSAEAQRMLENARRVVVDGLGGAPGSAAGYYSRVVPQTSGGPSIVNAPVMTMNANVTVNAETDADPSAIANTARAAVRDELESQNRNALSALTPALVR